MKIRNTAVAFALGVVVGAASIAAGQSNDGFRIFRQPPVPHTLPKQKTVVPAVSQDPAQLSLHITGRHQGRVVGKLMANVNGQWVEVQLAPQDALLKSR